VSAVIAREEILDLLKSTPPLIDGLRDTNKQVQPNGVDVTIRDVAMFTSPGEIGPQRETRVLSDTSQLVFDNTGAIHLSSGCYLLTHNEIVNLPKDIMALALPRSSLLRCGVSVHTAVWDAGYSGRSQSLMVVYNPLGFQLYKDAAVIQLVFFRLSHETSEGYSGIFQHENI